MNPAHKILAWLRDRAGDRWPVIVKTVDGVVSMFLLTFIGSLAAHGVFDGHLGTANTWKAAALAGVVAALNAAKSGIMILLTGQPAIGGLVSSQLRAQRELRVVRHPVPLREPAARRRARTARATAAPRPTTRGRRGDR